MNINTISFVSCNTLEKADSPFEFQGKLGSQTDAKQEILDFLTPLSAKVRSQNGSVKEIKNAESKMLRESPLFKQLLTQENLEIFKQLIANSPLRDEFYTVLPELDAFTNIVKEYPSVLFLADAPIAKIDKYMCGNLPTVTSTALLEGANSKELVTCLTQAIFVDQWTGTQLAIDRTQLQSDVIKKSLKKTYSSQNIERLFGLNSSQHLKVEDFQFFTTMVGQIFLYWMQNAFLLQKVSVKGPELLKTINIVKDAYKKTISDDQARAQFYIGQLNEIKASVVATQECHKAIYAGLCNQYQDPVNDLHQNPLDGTMVFLKKGDWQEGKTISLIDGDKSWEVKGRINGVLAKHINSQIPYLIFSVHSDAKDEQVAFEQIKSILSTYKFHQKQNNNLILLVGIDANIKKTTAAFEDFLDANKLVHTGSLGVTTLKERAITTQYAKAGLKVKSKGDYILAGAETLSAEITNQRLGISSDLDLQLLPSGDCPSDHFPITAQITVV